MAAANTEILEPARQKRRPLHRLVHAVRNAQARTIVIVGVVAALIWLVLGPVAMLVLSSFRATEGRLPIRPGVEWTLDNYVAVLTNPATYNVMLNTLLFAGGALVISFSLSVTFAWLIERTD